MKKILIFGAQGMLGQDFFKILSTDFEIIPFSRYNLDLFDLEKIAPAILELKPDIVINCSAFTDTEKAENSEYKDEVLTLNRDAPVEMAKACKELGAEFIHFSTDFVFDGKNPPYLEDSEKNSLNFYGLSKSEGEDCVQKIYSKSVIIRTAWLFGDGGINFVKKILSLSKKKKKIDVVDDIFVSMTYSIDLVNAVKELIMNNKFDQKIYHFVNEGQNSLFDIAKIIAEIKNFKVEISPVSSDNFLSNIQRPKKALLKNSSNIKLRPLKEALQDFLS